MINNSNNGQGTLLNGSTGVKEKFFKIFGHDIENGATSEEAIVQAGLDFRVAKSPNLHVLPSGNNVLSDNSFFTYRTDTEAILGDKVGRDYEVVQNREAFSFFDEIVGGKGGIQYESAGALERSFILRPNSPILSKSAGTI